MPPEFSCGFSRRALETWLAREVPESDPAVLRDIATRLTAQLEWLQGVTLLDSLERPQEFRLPPVASGRGQPEVIGFTFGPRFASQPATPSKSIPPVFVLFIGAVVGLLVAGAVDPILVKRERCRRHANTELSDRIDPAC